MKFPNLLDKYDKLLGPVKNNIPVVLTKTLKTHDKELVFDESYIIGAHEVGALDILSFIPFLSEYPRNHHGLTNTGLLLLQESIESYTYCVLGAQANTRFPIVSRGGSSLQTQKVFRKLVEDTISLNDSTQLIQNMRTAIKDTNVILNLAISPSLILVPSKMIILEKAIQGYNNILHTATKDMKFGVNTKVNFVGTRRNSVRHKPPTHDKPRKTIGFTERQHDSLDQKQHEEKKGSPTTHESVYLLPVSTLVGLFIAKFLI